MTAADEPSGALVLAAHMAATITVPIAMLVAAGLVWLWIRVGRQDLPRTILVLRRTTIALLALTLPGFVRGLSFVNPGQPNQQLQYVLTWTGVMAMVLLILLVACIDLLLVGKLERARAIDEMAELRWQVIEHDGEQASPQGPAEPGDGADERARPDDAPLEKRPDDAAG